MAAAAALGREPELTCALDRALVCGCPHEAVREALLMVSLFAGFPRTLDALQAWRLALDRDGRPWEPRPEAGLPAEPADRRELFRARGRGLFERVYGAGSRRVFERLLSLDPELPHWVLADAYGRVLARPGLSAAERERLAVVLLTALGLRNQLVGHVRGALNCGATADEVEASLAAAEVLPPAELAAARDALHRATAS